MWFYIWISDQFSICFTFQVQFSEKLNQQQTRYNIELTALRDQLLEAESQRDIMQRELQQMRESVDSTRLETITDSEETISELRKRYDREMKILLDDNRKLINELDVISETNRRLQNERIQIESDYEELRSKRQAIHQWERQISEVVQWISDDNDARAYLQALAAKMSEELDYIKHSGKFTIQQTFDIYKVCGSWFLLSICQALSISIHPTKTGAIAVHRN